MVKNAGILSIIFLCSASSLAYEITLTRIFSVSLWYHFAFMIISIAMLGIGASGTVLSLFPSLGNLRYFGIYSLLLGIGTSLSYVLANQIPFDPVKLSWSKAQILYIGMYYLTLSAPFFLTGLIVAAALSSMGGESGMLYGADLLGAGAGSLGILFCLTLVGPDVAVFVASLIALFAAFIAGGKRIRTIALMAIVLTVSVLLLNPSFINLRISPYKGLQTALRYPGAEHLKTYFSPYARIDTFKSTAARFAPGMSLKYLEAPPKQIGFSIDGGEVNAITAYRQGPSSVFLKYLPSALAYELGRNDDVLILDPKGGLQVLVADYYASSNIYKIESIPLLVQIIDREFRDFSGGIYSRNTWAGIGRSWLKYNSEKFDVIDIQMMGAAPSGSFGISEDYRFTVEAFKEYLDHLKTEGVLSMSLFILPPPRIELRILNTVVSSMNELGIRDVGKHVAAIRSLESICILIKKAPFEFSDIERIKSFSKDRWFDLIYYPGALEEETNIYIRMRSNEYFHVFENILNPETRRQFNDSYLFDVTAVHDENPFFHYYLRLKNIKQIYSVMGKKWQYFIEEGYILPVVFIQILFFSLVLIIVPAFVHRAVKTNEKQHPVPGRNLLPYFFFLGIGFMFVEISLIQKMIFPLENPPYAVATVLTSILVSSGMGSLLSHRVRRLKNPAILIAIALLVVAYSFFLPALSGVIAPYSIPDKILFVFIVLAPLGLLMGIPFPTGVKILSENSESMIPRAWAINGCLSVLSPILAVILAMSIGFKAVLWLGASAYLMAFVNLKIFLRDTR